MKCSKCNGTGTYKTKDEIRAEKRAIAVDLNRRGYSIRQIARKMGYASQRSIQILLEDKKA